MQRILLRALLPMVWAATAAAHTGATRSGTTPAPDLAGILTGTALFLVLESAILYLTFKPWFHDPNLPSPLPERYFHAAIYSFVARDRRKLVAETADHAAHPPVEEPVDEVMPLAAEKTAQDAAAVVQMPAKRKAKPKLAQPPLSEAAE